MRRATLLVLLSLLLASPVRAQDRLEEASVWFQRGEAAFQRNDPRGAAEAFEHAHRLVPHGATVYNVGLAWQAAGELGRAAQAFAEALDRGGLSDAQAEDARKRMDGLASRVGLLHVTAPSGAKISVAHFQRAAPPIDVYLAPGEHVVTVQFEDGEKITQRVQMETSRQELDVQPRNAPEATTGAVTTTNVESEGGSLHTLGWVAVGGAGALSGVAVYLGLEALEARDTFNESGHTDSEAHDRAASMRLWTNVAWVAAGASGVTGVVLLLSGDEEAQRETGGEIRLQVGAGSATLSGRW